MAIAAFILSIAALIIAGIAAWYARSEAVAAREIADIEHARRADEEAAVEAGRVRWRLRAAGKRMILLNEGTDCAYGVVVNSGKRSIQIDRLAAGRSKQIPFSGVQRVGVTWHYAEDRSDKSTTKAVLVDR